MKRTPTAKITSEKLCWRITKFKRDVSMYFVYVDKINKKKIGQTYGLPSAQKCCVREKKSGLGITELIQNADQLKRVYQCRQRRVMLVAF